MKTGKGSRTVTSIKSKRSIWQIKQMLATRPRDLALFVVGINWGLRGHDLLRLKWAQLLNEAGDLKKVVTIVESKNGNTRHIAMNKKVRSVLQPLLDHNIAVGATSVYVFPSRKVENGHARPMTNCYLHYLVNRWTQAVGLEGHFGGHTLRKTFGYHAYKQCNSLALLMSIFGHSSERMTLKYIGITQEMQEETYLKLSL